jgi:hypothetical protein
MAVTPSIMRFIQLRIQNTHASRPRQPLMSALGQKQTRQLYTQKADIG